MKFVIIKIFVIILIAANYINRDSFCQSESFNFELKLKENKRNSGLTHRSTPTDFNNLSTPKDFDSLKSNLKKDSKYTKSQKYKIKPLRLTLVGAAMGTVFAGLHIYYSNTWWKDQRNYFKYAEDGYYARDMDKASHIYTANLFTEASAIAYEWAGFSPKKSLVYGAITAFAYETYIELNDGFAPNWGFDWVDVGANLFGVLYPFIQRDIPVFKNINFKWSFKPKWLKGKAENVDDLLDDYTNMTFWLSVSPEGLLPKEISKIYPGFLAFAVGLSIKNASHLRGSTNAYREWFISLDYDINKLPGNSEFLKKLKKILNFYHFPSPAVRISPSGIWYGLYF